MRHFEHLHDLQALVGKEIGVSEWIAVEQQRIDQFATPRATTSGSTSIR